MFDPKVKMISLRESSNTSENLVKMMRNYRVPVGMSPEEIEKAIEFFD